MRVLFVRGYQGKATDERWYDAGTVAELEDLAAQALSAQGVVDILTAPEPEPVPAPEPLPRRSRRKEEGDEHQ